MTRIELEGEPQVQLMVGSDTTAAGMKGTLICLLTTPRVYRKLKNEIATAIANGVSSPISNAEFLQMPYLQAVILEGHPLRSPVIYGFYKVVPPGGDTINGVFFPGGTPVKYN